MRNLLTIIFLATAMAVTSQNFELSAELRPRYENRHGFGTLIEEGQDGNNFVSQRTRLNFDFDYNKLIFGVSVQNVRVWGDVGTLSDNDKAIAFHEAWAGIVFSENFSVLLGRQELIYDDSRIFGNVGWAQAGRSHDLALAKWKISENSKLDIGIAYNADDQSNFGDIYSNAAGYKAFQYAWFHTDINKVGLSFLLLNNGVEYEDINFENEVDYSQTIGSHVTFGKNKLKADFSVYFQTGKLKGNDVSSSYFAGNLKYNISNEFLLGLGTEYLSGKDMNDASTKVKSFNPLFGTNHKFNGWMDYFYVGNHSGSVGLIDVNAVFVYSKNKFFAKVLPHLFYSAADVYDGTTKMSNNLGVEVDLTAGYKFTKSIAIEAGFSNMWATESMEIVKDGGDSDANNYWGWAMVTFKPSLFKSKTPEIAE